MKPICFIHALVLLMLAASPTDAAFKAEPPKTIFGQTIILRPGVETWIEFELSGNHLINPKYASCGPGAGRSMRIRLERKGDTVLFGGNHRFSRVVHFHAVLQAERLRNDPWRFSVTVWPNRDFVEARIFSGNDTLTLSDFVLADE